MILKTLSSEILFHLLIVLCAFTLLAVMLASTGHSPVNAFHAMWNGAFGSWYVISSATLVRAIPLLFTGLAVALAFRTGILNIGAEGQFLAGATSATTVAWLFANNPSKPVIALILLSGALAGAAWASIAALLKYRYSVPEVISTIMLNFVALNATAWLVRGPLQEPTGIFPQSSAIPSEFRLTSLLAGTRLHQGILLAVILSFLIWWWLQHTASGFRARSTGENPDAAAVTGRIDIARTGLLIFLVSGALAGLGGAIELTGVTYALYENISPGYGYTAIAVALLAKLNPVGVIVSAFFFGALQAGGNAMQRDAGVPMAMVHVTEAIFILLVLAANRLRQSR